MSDILFIKTSSLGDVVHHMPALTEARRARPGSRFAWVVEEAFAPLVALHPGVAEVIPIAWRRWRKSLYAPGTLGEIVASFAKIRTRRYDEIIDSQGLLRSAAMARLTHGRRHGYDASSIREPLASAFYDVRHSVSRDLHAIQRNRALTGAVLGYRPEGDAGYGLDRAALMGKEHGRYALLLHATARAEKQWAEANWIALGKALVGCGLEMILPWGSAEERVRAERIATGIADARVGERQPLDAMARLIAGARLVVGVDTGLLHIAAALGVPLVAIFTGSKPGLTGPVGPGKMAVLGAEGASPSVDEVAAAVEKVVS